MTPIWFAVVSVAFALRFVGPTQAETDVLIRTVGFALTGNDNAQPIVIDRVKCIFAIEGDAFHLNNIRTDNLRIEAQERKGSFVPRRWVSVALHGDDIVFERTSTSLLDDGTEFMQQYKILHPDEFKPHHSTAKDHTLVLNTADLDRVRRAWEYIYGLGCSGKTSPEQGQISLKR
jgi:hypothetical protein